MNVEENIECDFCGENILRKYLTYHKDSDKCLEECKMGSNTLRHKLRMLRRYGKYDKDIYNNLENERLKYSNRLIEVTNQTIFRMRNPVDPMLSFDPSI